jgi:hypothetical protein
MNGPFPLLGFSLPGALSPPNASSRQRRPSPHELLGERRLEHSGPSPPSSLHSPVSTPTTPSTLPACAFDVSVAADLRLPSACTELQRSTLGVVSPRRLAPPRLDVSLAVSSFAACAAPIEITATLPSRRLLRSLPASLQLAPSLDGSLPDSSPTLPGPGFQGLVTFPNPKDPSTEVSTPSKARSSQRSSFLVLRRPKPTDSDSSGPRLQSTPS